MYCVALLYLCISMLVSRTNKGSIGEREREREQLNGCNLQLYLQLRCRVCCFYNHSRCLDNFSLSKNKAERLRDGGNFFRSFLGLSLVLFPRLSSSSSTLFHQFRLSVSFLRSAGILAAENNPFSPPFPPLPPPPAPIKYVTVQQHPLHTDKEKLSRIRHRGKNNPFNYFLLRTLKGKRMGKFSPIHP